MDYAIQLLFPILGGLLLGYWLTQNYGISPIWTVVLAILGMFGGLGIMYKRFAHPELYKKTDFPTTSVQPKKTNQSSQSSSTLQDLGFLYTDEDEQEEDNNPRSPREQ